MSKKHYRITRQKEMELLQIIDTGVLVQIAQYDYGIYKYNKPINIPKDKLPELINILEKIRDGDE